jgi:hypothetical protein
MVSQLLISRFNETISFEACLHTISPFLKKSLTLSDLIPQTLWFLFHCILPFSSTAMEMTLPFGLNSDARARVTAVRSQKSVFDQQFLSPVKKCKKWLGFQISGKRPMAIHAFKAQTEASSSILPWAVHHDSLFHLFVFVVSFLPSLLQDAGIALGI